jgi:hypothetical protein
VTSLHQLVNQGFEIHFAALLVQGGMSEAPLSGRVKELVVDRNENRVPRQRTQKKRTACFSEQLVLGDREKKGDNGR